ncbi:MAG TPA: isochorismatase family cysteine hydrolase [Longimicrobium sp.]|nr:isochorismatase family cysteine hydrolase [Longimicrobium sp.]
MPEKNQDLHGMVPDAAPVALLLIDVINAMDFPDGGERLAENALPAARRLAELRRRAKELEIPVIYANDNFGKWRSDFREVVEHALEDVPGRPIAELLRPEKDDYFVLKPKHSAFYATTLDVLLKYLGTRRLVMAGFSGDVCVLFTAGDAYMRDLHVHVPADCVASVSDEENHRALAYMRRVLDVRTAPSTVIDLRKLLEGEDQ